MIEEIFGGHLLTQITCTSCKHTSYTFNKFWQLDLEIDKQTSSMKNAPKYTILNLKFRISEYLKKYFKTERISDYKCSNCLKRVTIEKKFSIYNFPEVLIVFFKRFSFFGLKPEKLTGKVTIPFDETDLEPFSYKGHGKLKKKFEIFSKNFSSTKNNNF